VWIAVVWCVGACGGVDWYGRCGWVCVGVDWYGRCGLVGMC